MSDEDGSKRPAPEGFGSWSEYWKAQGMPWRTEPEIDGERQRFLAERRLVKPDIEQGIYPFRGIKLQRADVEWLLATHESGGMFGPVDWSDPSQRIRDGLDLRGSDLRGEDLRDLPLARLRGGLFPWSKAGIHDEWFRALPSQREAAAIHLQECNLGYAHLEGATLAGAHIEGGLLQSVHLEGARLREVHIEGVRLNGAYLDRATNLIDANLTSNVYGSVHLADVRWGEANLAWMNWSSVKILGNERRAHQRREPNGKLKMRQTRLHEYLQAVRANQQIKVMLRNQGLNEKADQFAYRGLLCQRVVLRLQRRPLRYLASGFLWVISGYGYRPLRSFMTYLLVVLGFAAAYYLLGANVHPVLSPVDATVFSITSFHGRGFSPNETVTLDNPLTVLAAVEAIIGLLIEIIFIATFTQRFFAR